jgi:hypothetical protein
MKVVDESGCSGTGSAWQRHCWLRGMEEYQWIEATSHLRRGGILLRGANYITVASEGASAAGNGRTAVSNLVSYFHAVVGVHTVGTHKHHARTY